MQTAATPDCIPSVEEAPGFVIRRFSLFNRIAKASAALVFGVGIWFPVATFEPAGWLLWLLLSSPGVFVAWKFYTEKEIQVPTRDRDGRLTQAAKHRLAMEAALEHQAAAARQRKRGQFFERFDDPITAGLSRLMGSGWGRYAGAALCLYGAAQLVSSTPANWGGAMVLVVVATILAREISAIALWCLALYLIVKGIAMLPVSVALIVAALIITSSRR